jgi:hypothetical protein
VNVLISPDAGSLAKKARLRRQKAAEAPPVVVVEGPRPLEIPTEAKVPRPRREPRPHFPHLIRPRPVGLRLAAPTAGDPVDGE